VKVLDLFAGAGGMALGLQSSGHEIVHSVDNWQAAHEVLSKNFDHPASLLDLSDKSTWDQALANRFDVISGGPPCQDFSIAGGRQTDGARANLTLSFAQMIERAKPKFFVMENVYSIVGTEVLAKAHSIFEQTGYSLTSQVIDASYVGVPQARKRYILVGALKAKTPSLGDFYSSRGSESRMTVADHFGKTLGTEFYYAHPRSYKRRAVFSIHEPSATIRGVNRPMPDSYNFHTADKCNDRQKIRPLTTLERAQIQTFPKSFVFVDSKSQSEQLIGNAVPVNLARFIGDFLATI
jgi:DNA (cytosine-5)-methyltransferase 1